MTKKGLLIWAILLAVPGAVGLWTVWSQNNARQEQIARWRPLLQKQTDQYLESYQQWNSLKADQKLDSPWGQGTFGGPEIQKELLQDQDKRLAVDLDELANGSKSVPPELGRILYGQNWLDRVDQYSRTQDTQDLIKIGSSVCLGTGCCICVLSAIVGLFQVIRPKSATPQDTSAGQTEPAQIRYAEPLVAKQTATSGSVNPETKPGISESLSDLTSMKSGSTHAGYFESIRSAGKTAGLSTHGATVAAAVSEPAREALTMMTTEPVLNSLTELTEEVSAIRQFAANQQDQMKKLQDGYDWMLIRRFCLRIIRCIDNTSDRIRTCRQENKDVRLLEEIRDELVFALESGGIEQFEPDPEAEYKGLERYAEAIHDKEPNDQPQRSGRIARVLRPGYQYLISDEEVKIVRCAQVQLYQ